MNPEDQKVPAEEWQQPLVSSSQAPYQAVPDAGMVEQPQDDIVTDVQSAPETEAEPVDNSDDTALVRWQSTEYLHQERTALWYVALAGVTLVLMVAAYIVIRSLTFTILLPVMAATLVMYVRRPPTPNDYSISRKGIHINDKLYTYDQFRSFGVLTHQGHHSVALVPRKRFQLGQTIYFPEEVGEALVDMLAARLPMKNAEPDLIDRILARLHL
jgi:hypothetical protein